MRDATALNSTHQLFRLDVIRLVASIGIVLFHIQYYTKASIGDVVDNTRFALLVDLFFVISGVVISHVYGSFIETADDALVFLKRRIARLGPLHWLTAALFLVVNLVCLAWLQQVGIKPQEVGCLVSNFSLTHSFSGCKPLSLNWPSWSISAEIVAYVCFALFCVLIPARRRSLVAATIIAAAIALIVLQFWSPRPWYKWTFDGGALRALPSFFLGLLLQTLRQRLVRLPVPPYTWAVLMICGLTAAQFSLPQLVVVSLFHGAVASAYIEDLRKPPGAILRQFAKAGDFTYSIYLWHSFLYLTFVTVIAKGVLGLGFAGQTAAVVLALATLPLVALASSRWFERPAKLALIAWLGSSRRMRSA